MTDERMEKLRLELRRGVLVLAVLGLLKQPHYGYSLRKQLQDAGVGIDEGTLYPLIRRLADQGLLDSEWREEGGRERRYYQVSKEGKHLLESLANEWRQLNHHLGKLLEVNHDTD